MFRRSNSIDRIVKSINKMVDELQELIKEKDQAIENTTARIQDLYNDRDKIKMEKTRATRIANRLSDLIDK